MSAIGSALARAGFDIGKSRLYVTASEAYAAAGGNTRGGGLMLARACAKDAALLAALAEHFISTVIAKDARGPVKEFVRGGHPTAADCQVRPATSHDPVETEGARLSVPGGHSSV